MTITIIHLHWQFFFIIVITLRTQRRSTLSFDLLLHPFGLLGLFGSTPYLLAVAASAATSASLLGLACSLARSNDLGPLILWQGLPLRIWHVAVIGIGATAPSDIESSNLPLIPIG